MKTENAAMKTENAVLQKENAVLQTENAAMKTENAVLQTENAAMKTENAALQTENAVLQKENAALQTENAVLQTENAALRLQLQQVNLDSDAAAWKAKYEAAAEELRLVKLRDAALPLDDRVRDWHLLPPPLMELIEGKSGLPLLPLHLYPNRMQDVLTAHGYGPLQIPLRVIVDPRARFDHTHDFEEVRRCYSTSRGVASLFVCKVSRGSAEAAGD